jgi:pyridoxine/pyridoxamine 5'-phosphate oxidase
MIIWGVWFDDSFWFSTGAVSRKGRNLAENPRCSIGTDDAAKAVIFEGTVEMIDSQHAGFEKFAKAYEKEIRLGRARDSAGSVSLSTEVGVRVL